METRGDDTEGASHAQRIVKELYLRYQKQMQRQVSQFFVNSLKWYSALSGEDSNRGTGSATCTGSTPQLGAAKLVNNSSKLSAVSTDLAFANHNFRWGDSKCHFLEEKNKILESGRATCFM